MHPKDFSRSQDAGDVPVLSKKNDYQLCVMVRTGEQKRVKEDLLGDDTGNIYSDK